MTLPPASRCAPARADEPASGPTPAHDRGPSFATPPAGCLLQAIEQSGDMVMVTDPNGIIEYVNPAFERITGYGAADVIGRTPRLLKSGSHDAALYAELWCRLRSGQAFRGILANRRADDSIYYEDKTIRALKGSDGALTHFVSTGRDVTQAMTTRHLLREARGQLQRQRDAIAELSRRHERELAAARAAADQAAYARHQLLASVSYEMRMPLRNALEIARSAEQASNEEPSALRLRFSRLRCELERQSSLVDDLLLLRGPVGETALQRVPTELGVLVAAIVRETRSHAALRDITLTTDRDTESARLRIDPGRIAHALRHLLDNAVRFSPRGGEVRVGARRDPHDSTRWLIFVEDCGPGIPPEELEAIFEPFRRGSRTRTSCAGLGIGLAVSRAIAQVHGGSLTATNRPEGGARIVLGLPAE